MQGLLLLSLMTRGAFYMWAPGAVVFILYWSDAPRLAAVGMAAANRKVYCRRRIPGGSEG